MSMSKAELIEALHHRFLTTTRQLSREALREIVDNFVDIVQSQVQRGRTVRLTGIGSFTKTTHRARSGINPKTREVIDIPSRNKVKFKQSSTWKV